MAKQPKWRQAQIFDPHHAIERQTVMVGLSLSLVIGGMIYSEAHWKHVQYQQLMKVDQAGAKTNFSKTSDVSVTLGETQLSMDGKTAFIPISFSSTDSIGIRANDYRVYVGAASGKTMQNKVRGHLIMYGTHGRAVIVVHATKRMANQPLAIFLLSLKHVQTADVANADDTVTANNGSTYNDFGKYDVAPIKLNPGATAIKKKVRLTVSPTDKVGIYRDLFGDADRRVVNKAIKKDQTALKKNLAAANGLKERLKAQGFKLPDDPKWIKNDWRPYDTVNLDTGKTANGQSALTYDGSTGEASADDPDQVQYPDQLEGANGATTDTTNANAGSDDDDNSSSIGGNQTSASQLWSNLTNVWDKIHSLKRDIWVVQRAKLYQIKHDEKQIHQQATTSSDSHFRQISKVKE